MKKTLAYDRNATQFRTDVEGRRFYLGGDQFEAEKRKLRIVTPIFICEGIIA